MSRQLLSGIARLVAQPTGNAIEDPLRAGIEEDLAEGVIGHPRFAALLQQRFATALQTLILAERIQERPERRFFEASQLVTAIPD